MLDRKASSMKHLFQFRGWVLNSLTIAAFTTIVIAIYKT